MCWGNAVLTAKPDHILLLAGTQEARLLARELAEKVSSASVTASFAGAVRDLPDLDIPVRVGGFGGVEGLIGYLEAEKVGLIVDATHPFAAQMSRHACEAADRLGIDLIRLERPAWKKRQGDRWTLVPSLEEAAAAIPRGARVFLAIGGKEIGTFTAREDCFALARMIEPPPVQLPGHWHLELARPPEEVESEIALLETHGITHLVSKNSGGERSYAKIEAARRLGLPVIMVRYPDLPDAVTAHSVRAMLDLLTSRGVLKR